MMICKTVLCLLVFTGSGWLHGQPNDLSALIEKIDGRSKSYKEYHEYSANAVSVYREMDEHWNPEKVTTVCKQVTQRGSGRTETVTRAVEVQKGKEVDITAKVLEGEKKRQKRAKNKPDDQKPSQKEGKNQTFAVGFKELYPFSAEERKKYVFIQKPDTVLSGKPVLCIETRSKEKNSNRYEGKFYIDSETFDIIRLDIAPAKNPRFVKDIRIQMAFEMLPGNYWMFKSFRMRIYASILIKKIRMEAEESYSDFTIFR